jgi:ribosome maturation factor RimP
MDDVERMAQIEEAVAPVVGDHGLELVDLEWRGLRPRGVLRLYVDKAGGIGIAECERLSRELGDVLDAACRDRRRL